MMSFLMSYGQKDEISKKMAPNDSLNVTVKFEKVKLTKEDNDATTALNALISNSMQTTADLSNSFRHLTSVLETNLSIMQKSKTQRVAELLSIKESDVRKFYKRKTTYMLIALIPVLLIAFGSVIRFFFEKGLDVKHFLAGTAVMALCGLLGSAALYGILSLVFNQQYFIIKDLMNSMF